MARSEARIAIDRSSRTLEQLCRRFAPKVPVVHIRERGQIVFPRGSLRLEAEGGLLIVEVEAEDEAAVARLEEVVARHLARFHDRLTISWASLEGLKF